MENRKRHKVYYRIRENLHNRLGPKAYEELQRLERERDKKRETGEAWECGAWGGGWDEAILP